MHVLDVRQAEETSVGISEIKGNRPQLARPTMARAVPWSCPPGLRQAWVSPGPRSGFPMQDGNSVICPGGDGCNRQVLGCRGGMVSTSSALTPSPRTLRFLEHEFHQVDRVRKAS